MAIEPMKPLTVAFCTYKRAGRLERLVGALRAQDCPVPFEILAVNNNSPDNTLEILDRLQALPGAPLRVVTEPAPGIVPARNRALRECLGSDIMVFIDDDELPQPGLLAAAYDAIAHEGAQCAGGRVEMDFSTTARPKWLVDELLGFLGQTGHGSHSFWIKSIDTPIWSGNIAYDTKLFNADSGLRFDPRYNRRGVDLGGGEDAMMFRTLLERGTRIRYRPDMAVWHNVEAWRLNRVYFLRLHYRAGLRAGLYALPVYPRHLMGVPPFLVRQAAQHIGRAVAWYLLGRPGALRQGMNATHALGSLVGYWQRSRLRPWIHPQ